MEDDDKEEELIGRVPSASARTSSSLRCITFVFAVSLSIEPSAVVHQTYYSGIIISSIENIKFIYIYVCMFY